MPAALWDNGKRSSLKNVGADLVIDDDVKLAGAIDDVQELVAFDMSLPASVSIKAAQVHTAVAKVATREGHESIADRFFCCGWPTLGERT